MALRIVLDPAVPGAFLADRRLYLTADKARVVEEGDAEAAFLFAPLGGPISAEDAARYGLADPADAPVVAETAPEPTSRRRR